MQEKKFCLVESLILGFGIRNSLIQLKETGIPLTTKNPESSSWNPESPAWSPESKDSLTLSESGGDAPLPVNKLRALLCKEK